MDEYAEISMATAFQYLRTALKLGFPVDYEVIGQKYNLGVEYLIDRTKRLPLPLFLQIARDTEKCIADPIFAIKVARQIELTKMEGFEELMYVGRNVQEALEILIRYLPVFSEMGQMRLEPVCPKAMDGVTYKLVFEPLAPDLVSRQIVDARMMFLYRYAQCLGGEGFAGLHLNHHCPVESEQEYRALYDIPVQFGQKQTCFLISQTWLEHRVTKFAEPSFHRLSTAERTLNRTSGASLGEQVEFILRRRLPIGDVSCAQVASALGMNLRTFQRRLKANELSYASLLEKTREKMAIEYLAAENNSINEISNWLGYSDLSSFLRAFKQWTGIGPGKYRQLFLTSSRKVS
ncbi:AraC family transcriptional regulator [Maricurvus nonylphenolicus]|uniref:AraC family transcriptional regulator n=1 Tax=Maricurvus nonylphenolicus TaxID=1008307 RepID=UPI0036F3E624